MAKLSPDAKRQADAVHIGSITDPLVCAKVPSNPDPTNNPISPPDRSMARACVLRSSFSLLPLCKSEIYAVGDVPSIVAPD